MIKSAQNSAGSGRGTVTGSGIRPPTTAAEQPLASIKAAKLFPGRTSLYCHEVAKALRVSVPQVLSFIEEGALLAVEVTGRGNKTSREHWRIPVGEFDRFVESRRSDKKGGKA